VQTDVEVFRHVHVLPKGRLLVVGDKVSCLEQCCALFLKLIFEKDNTMIGEESVFFMLVFLFDLSILSEAF
jgi:hypothetical protein